MRFKTLNGGVRAVSKAKKRLIKWSGPSRSKRQRLTKLFLKKYWKHHIVFEEFPVAGTKLTIDIYNANKKIAVEVQGRQHTKYVPFFHGKNKANYLNQLRRDQDKLEFCKLNNITLVEIYEEDNIDQELFKKFGIEL